MAFAIGTALFALGIVVSLALHEAGHALAAQAFGMKVTRFFIGYGPTLFSFRRRGVEYGVKAIPAGAFVRIVGMTPLDDVAPEDHDRAMFRFPVWKRTIVMSAGAIVHFGLGLFVLWALFAVTPLPDNDKLQTSPVRVAALSTCTPGPCPAALAGLRPGDVITAIDGAPVRGWADLTRIVRSVPSRPVRLTYTRNGLAHDATVTMAANRLGVSPVVPTSVAGPVAAFGLAGAQAKAMVVGTADSLVRLPAKVPALWTALTGGARDPDTPVSVVGASRIGGELVERGELPSFVLMLASLNFLLGLFNLLPLLPADGGHIAVFWFERARSWLWARLGRPAPGRVDYLKLAPLTLAVIAVFAGFTLLTVAADIVNPVTLS